MKVSEVLEKWKDVDWISVLGNFTEKGIEFGNKKIARFERELKECDDYEK